MCVSMNAVYTQYTVMSCVHVQGVYGRDAGMWRAQHVRIKARFLKLALQLACADVVW